MTEATLSAKWRAVRERVAQEKREHTVPHPDLWGDEHMTGEAILLALNTRFYEGCRERGIETEMGAHQRGG